MCTLIVDWSEKGYLVGANRDERLDRKCDDNFTWKSLSTNVGVNYFCPTDLRGGTWFGINDCGIFSAITNAAYRKKSNINLNLPKMSRGGLTTEALNAKDEKSAVTLAIHKLVDYQFRPFNLVIGGKQSCWLIEGNGSGYFSVKPICGKYIITADWPVVGPTFNKHYPIHRLDYIAKNIHDSRITHINWYSSEGEYKMYEILKYRADDKVENAVCVYDPNEEYKTRSSCILHSVEDDGVYLSWTDKAPDVFDLIGFDKASWKNKRIHC